MFYSLTKDQRDMRKKEKKANQVNCPLCPASLQGLLKQKAFCIFCLNYVCKTHIVKKRKDPLIEDKIGKICRECEDLILYQKIMSKHQKKEQELQVQDKEFSNNLNNVNSQFQDLLSQEQTIKYQIDKDQKEHEKKDQQIKLNIKEAEDRQNQLNQESLKLSEQYRKLVEIKQGKEKEKQLLQEQLEKLQNDEQEIQLQNQQIQDQIKIVSENNSKLTLQIAQLSNNVQNDEREKKSIFNAYTTSNFGTIQIDSKQASEIMPRPSKQKKEIDQHVRSDDAFCCYKFIPSKSKKPKKK
ncbi:unnamed protein product [Paramecium sonneborni]|uniref:Uncharacterized protein n=1 Tax=Paramecium sonneborni TaxID=65129 RepID=A0A8S1MYX5_9CILI|nr:unnamed protein product [Paramecium sonneborni]